MKTISATLYCTIVSISILVGCVSLKSTTVLPALTTTTFITPVSSTLSISTTSATPETPVLPSTPTLYPTQSLIQLEHTIELLESESCTLPCYLGITPGVTKWGDARKSIEEVGAVYLGGDAREINLPVYGFVIIHWRDTKGSGQDYIMKGIGGHIDLVVGNGIVQRMIVGISANNLPLFQKHWSRYTLKEILVQLGEPDQVYFDVSVSGIGYGITVVYEKQGIVAEMNGYKDGNSLCTNIEGFPEILPYSIRLTLTNISSGLSLYDPNRIPPTNLEISSPVDEILGMDKKEFYEQIIADPEVCFEVKTLEP